MKKILFLFFLVVTNQILTAQETKDINEEIDEIIDNVILLENEELIDIINELNNYHVILTSFDYSNKTFFLGRDLGLDQFSFSPQIMYQNHHGIFIDITGNYYSEFNPKWDLTVLSAGYGIDFGKKDNFRAEAGYSRYLFSDLDSNDFENSLDLVLYFVTDNNSFGATVNSSYLFGDRTGYQSNISIYSKLKLFDINPKKESTLSFQPDLSFQFASENIDTSRFDDIISDFPFINRVVNSFETFSLRNIQLQLPIALDLQDFQIEMGYNINFPSAFDFENSVENTSFFNLGVSYIFTLK